MVLVDALGNLIRFVLLPGQRHDSIGVEPLITGLDFEALIGDKAFDNNWLRANLNERGAAAVIPSKADRAGRIPHDAEMYKWRHLVENLLLLSQGIPTHRDPLRKDRHLLCWLSQSRREFPRQPLTVNRP